VKFGDVLVSTVRPNLNAVALVPEELDNQIASTGFCVLRNNPKHLDNRYLFYRTLTAEFVNHLVSRMRGANYPAVTDRAVKEVSIPLPPLSEQRHVVETLDQADALRRKRAEADAKAARILPSLFYQMFGDLTNNHKSWDVVKLEQIASSERYITYGIVQAGPHVPDGIPYIRSGDITNGSVSTDKLLRTSREIANRYKRSEVKYGDLVFSNYLKTLNRHQRRYQIRAHANCNNAR
jgi:type I restriction enzyme S subunit